MDWHRILREKRRILLPLAIAAVANVAAYFLIVYPLGARAGAAEARATTAAVNLALAKKEFLTAEGTKTGRDRADVQLKRFYQQVLPRDLPGARRVTYPRLARLARESNLDPDRRSFIPKHEHDSPLTRLEGTIVLQGEYRDIRQFIHKLETAPEFVVLREVSVAQGDRNEPLTLTLRLETYYRPTP